MIHVRWSISPPKERFAIQGIHRRRNGGGAEAAEGRRDQHLLRGFGPSVRALPQVSIGDVSGWRTRQNPGKLTPLYWFSASLFGRHQSVLVCLFFLTSQDHDAVSAEAHQNSGQVLVPQELPVPNFQGMDTLGFSFLLFTDVQTAAALSLSLGDVTSRQELWKKKKSRWNLQQSRRSFFFLQVSACWFFFFNL